MSLVSLVVTLSSRYCWNGCWALLLVLVSSLVVIDRLFSVVLFDGTVGFPCSYCATLGVGIVGLFAINLFYW